MDAWTFYKILLKANKPSEQKGFIENPKTLGEKLRNKRLSMGLEQKEMAKIIGVCTDTITGWENGRSRPMTRYHALIKEILDKPSG